MSIGGISANLSALHMQSHAKASVSGSAAAGDVTGSVANTGTVSSGNMNAFFKSFSADLQAMLSKGGNALGGANAPGGGNASGVGGTGQTAANQPLAGAPHHHHHHPEGGSGSPQGAGGQTTTQIGTDPNGGPPSASGFSNTARVFAADVMHALRAYGATASS